MPDAARRSPSRRAWIAGCVLVVLAGVLVRAWIHTRSPITPSIDGGYYAIQPRSLIAHGKLDYPDMPLKFALDAGLARCLQATTAMTLDEACMRASQVTDCVGPALIAVPVFLIAASVGGGTALWSACAIALLLVAGGPALRMVGDFQKNSLALVWYAAALQQALRALAAIDSGRTPWPRVSSTGVLVALATLTHAGTGAAAAFNVALIAAVAVIVRPDLRRAMLGWRGAMALVAGIGSVGAAFLVIRWLDPVRAARIVSAVARLASDDGGSGARRGGPTFMPLAYGPFAAAALASALSWWRVVRTAAARAWAERAVCCGCAIACLVFTLPAIDGDAMGRLALVAMVPGAVAVLLSLASGPTGARGAWPAWLVMAAVPLTAPPAIAFASRPSIDPDSLDELRAMHALVPEHRGALLVARHGLEFWANYAIDVNTRQSGIPADAFTRYERVLVLVERQPSGPMAVDASRDGRRERFGPPPGRNLRDGPPGMGPPPGDGPGRGPPGGPRGMRPPAGSGLIHSSEHYRLFEVPRDAATGEGGDDAPTDDEPRP